MRLLRTLSALTLALNVLTAAASAAAPRKPGDILAVASANKNFSIFIKAIRAAGLEDTLKDPGPYTVFAPTDAAFKKLPEGTLDNLMKPENKDQLKSVLLSHIVKGKCTAAEVVKSAAPIGLKSLQDTAITLNHSGKVVTVCAVKLTSPDAAASNGVIQGIDEVMISADKAAPPDSRPESKPVKSGGG